MGDRTEYQKEYRQNHPDEIARNRQNFLDRHPGINTEYVTRWRKNHREQYNAYMREYYRKKKGKK